MADEAKPMAEAPEEPTDAQRQQGASVGGSPVVQLTDEQREVAEADAKAISENPNEAHIREANPIMGGESFDYGQPAKSE